MGKNLHDARHVEWPAGAGANDELRCSVYLDLTIRYTASDGSGNETTAKPTFMVPHSKKP